MPTPREAIDALVAFSAVDTNNYNFDAIALRTALDSLADAVGQGGDGGLPALVALAQAAADAAQAAQGSAQSFAGNAGTSETNANASDLSAQAQVAVATALKVIVDAYCNADPSVEPEAGHKGVRYYLQKVLDATVLVGTKGTSIISDAAALAGNYTVQPSDLGTTKRCQNTTHALHVIAPRDLWKSAAPDGTPGLNFVEFVKEGDGVTFGTVDFAGQSGVQTLPTVLFSDVRSFAVNSPPVATPFVYDWGNIPGGVNRRLTVFAMSIFNAVDGARSTTLTGTYAGSPLTIVRDVADTGLSDFFTASGAWVDAVAWSGAIPDAATAQDLTTTYNAPQNELSHVVVCIVTQDTNGQESVIGASTTTNGTSATGTLTPTGTGRLGLMMWGFQGADAQPITSTDGGSIQNGKTPLIRPAKDISFAVAAFAWPDGAAHAHAATSAKSTRTATLGVLIKPQAGTPGMTLKAKGGTTAIGTNNGKALLEFLSDGMTSFLNCD